MTHAGKGMNQFCRILSQSLNVLKLNSCHMQGYYSFVEDFRRDGHSPKEHRDAEFGRGWVHTLAGSWVELTRAHFTGDSTPLMNIDAGASTNSGWFFLKTGGAITNSTTELWKNADRPSAAEKPPEFLSSFVPEDP